MHVWHWVEYIESYSKLNFSRVSFKLWIALGWILKSITCWERQLEIQMPVELMGQAHLCYLFTSCRFHSFRTRETNNFSPYRGRLGAKGNFETLNPCVTSEQKKPDNTPSLVGWLEKNSLVSLFVLSAANRAAKCTPESLICQTRQLRAQTGADRKIEPTWEAPKVCDILISGLLGCCWLKKSLSTAASIFITRNATE